MFSDGDDNQGIVLGVVFGVIALVIGLVISLGIYQTRMWRHAAPAALVVPGGAQKITVGPAVVIGPTAATGSGGMVELSVVKIYFDPGQSGLPVGATEALASLAREVVAGRSLTVNSYHGATGDASKKAEIARQRAVNVRDLLASLGVSPDRIEMRRLQSVGEGAAGAEAETRKVEVVVR